MEIITKFKVGDKVTSKYDDDWDEFNGVGEIEEVIVLVRYKVKFKKIGKWGKVSEEDLKLA